MFFLASSSLYCIWVCEVFVHVVICNCTGLYVYTSVIYCILCSNACTSANDMIFLHMLVQTMQVPMYSFRGFCPLSGWLPNWSRPCTLIDFVVATKSALRPWAYFSLMSLHTAFEHHTLYRWFSYFLLYAWLCHTNISCRYLCIDSEFLPTPGLANQLVLGLHPHGFRGSYRECA